MPFSSSSLFAYGYRYRTPYMRLIVFHYSPSISCFSHLPYQTTSLFRPRVSCTLSFFSPYSFSLSTGNSLLSRMEVLSSLSGIFTTKYCSGGENNRKKAMIAQLQRYGVFDSEKVAEVMETIDRGLFVPEGTDAYVDSPMAIGFNATISAPHMHAMCLQLLKDKLQPGMHVLDVGSGTGYLTACFAMMVGPQGLAVGIEHIPELASWSIKNIKNSAAAALLKEGSLSIQVGDGRLGWPDATPYDAIHVGAAAPEIPKALIEQLKPGGRLVIPVGTFFQDLQVVDKQEDGSISVRTETSVRYVPLTSREQQLHS